MKRPIEPVSVAYDGIMRCVKKLKKAFEELKVYVYGVGQTAQETLETAQSSLSQVEETLETAQLALTDAQDAIRTATDRVVKTGNDVPQTITGTGGVSLEGDLNVEGSAVVDGDMEVGNMAIERSGDKTVISNSNGVVINDLECSKMVDTKSRQYITGVKTFGNEISIRGLWIDSKPVSFGNDCWVRVLLTKPIDNQYLSAYFDINNGYYDSTNFINYRVLLCGNSSVGDFKLYLTSRLIKPLNYVDLSKNLLVGVTNSGVVEVWYHTTSTATKATFTMYSVSTLGLDCAYVIMSKDTVLSRFKYYSMCDVGE